MDFALDKITAKASSEENEVFVLSKKDRYYKGLRADPNEPIRVTKDPSKARKFDSMSKAVRFARENNIKKRGFSVEKVEI